MRFDLQTVLSTGALLTALAGIVFWAVKLLVESRLNTASQQALESFKHGLGSAAAAASFDYQRQLQNFNLFVIKKHEALAQLHEFTLDAASQISRFAEGARDRPILLGMHADDVSDYLEHHASIPRGKRAEIMALWGTDPDRALVVLYEYQDTMQKEYARRALVKANNYRLKHDLYFPEALSQLAADLNETLNRLLHHPDAGTEQGAFTTRAAAQQIQVQLDELKALMRAEMARAEFTDFPSRGPQPYVSELIRPQSRG